MTDSQKCVRFRPIDEEADERELPIKEIPIFIPSRDFERLYSELETRDQHVVLEVQNVQEPGTEDEERSWLGFEAFGNRFLQTGATCSLNSTCCIEPEHFDKIRRSTEDPHERTRLAILPIQ